MSRHAQESRTVKIAKSPKMTTLLETVPVIALTGISFGGSCGNIFNFFGACGIGSVFQFGDTACPDLLCLVAAREILRDRRLSREKKFGWITWPMAVLIIGIMMTLALNFLGDDKAFLKWVSGSAWAPVAGLLPGAFLLLVLAIFHRRETGTAEASGTKAERRRTPASTGTATPKTADPVPAPAGAPVPAEPAREVAASTAEPAEPAERTAETLLADARAYRGELAANGERVTKEKLRLRFTISSGKALQLLQALNDSEKTEAVI
jgi:hypothetical protein